MEDALRSLLLAEGHNDIRSFLAVKGEVSCLVKEEVPPFTEDQTLRSPDDDAPAMALTKQSTTKRKPVWLAASELGLSLVVTDDEGAVIPVELSTVRYRSKLLEDDIEIGDDVYGIPLGKRDAALELLGLARLLPLRQAPGGVERRRHIEPRGPIDKAALAALLDPGEVLLVWLQTATSRKIDCLVEGQCEVELTLMISDRRVALVGVSRAGEIVTLPLPRRPFAIKKQIGRDEIRAQDLVFHAHSRNEDLFGEIKDIAALNGLSRIREVLRIDFESRGTNHDTSNECGPLLTELLERQDAVSVLVASCTSLSLSRRIAVDERLRAAAELARVNPNGEDIGAIYDAWHLNLDEGVSLLEGLLAQDDLRAAAVPLHRKIHRDLCRGADGFALAAIDIAFAEHLVESGAFVEAEDMLKERLDKLPSEELADLLPPQSADLMAGAGGQEFKIRLLELQSLAIGRGKPHLDTVVELARLQPLVKSRIQQLAELTQRDGAQAALLKASNQVLAILEPHGLAMLADDASDSPDDEVHQFLDQDLLERIKHPATRDGHVMDRLQAFVAEAQVPNHNSLKNFCERLKEGDVRHRNAASALADAAFVFGIRSVDGFVSRGERGVGVRAYEGSPPFVLIGGEHLEEGGAFELHPWELRFAIASEIAHLRFGHTRVTTSDVWEGAWKKGKASVSFVVSFLPVLSGWKVADRLADLISKATKSPVGRVLKGVNVTEKAMKEIGGGQTSATTSEIIGHRGADLIAAHRVMQLTADRAGLLFSADIGAAVRSIFLEDPQTRAELPLAIKHGLGKVLGRRDDDGEILYQGLAIRICALVSFYLSEDYRVLRRALTVGDEASGEKD